jgi:hypothetical protein
MKRIVRIRVFCITSAVALMTFPCPAAQQALSSGAAAVRIQILTGTKVFISHGAVKQHRETLSWPMTCFMRIGRGGESMP